MKLPTVSFFVPLGVGLIAAALLWKQQQEIELLQLQASTADHELVQKTAESAQWEKQVQVAQQKTHSLEAALATAKENADAVNTPMPKPGKALALALEGGNSSPEQIKQWLTDAADPAVMRRLNLQAQAMTLKRYGGLLQQLNLPPAQNEALVKLLVDKRQNPLDTAVADLQQGVDPSQDVDGYRDLINANRLSIDNQIQALLGDAGFSQYQDYTRNTGQSAVISNVQMALNNTSEPLTPDQTAQLQQTLQDNNTTRINAKVIADAKNFLTPLQVQTLQDIRAIQQANSQRRNQPGQILPTSPPPPAAKK